MKAELILEDENMAKEDDVMVKGVKLDLTPTELLVLNQALRDYLSLDRHEEDKQIARTMLENMREDFEKYREPDNDWFFASKFR